MKKYKLEYFLYGYLIHNAIMSLCQDFLGKEKYIETVQEHWTSGAITIPLAVATIALVVFCVIWDKVKEDK